MEVYKTLKEDMSRALRLKQLHAELMSNIVKTFKEINKHLDDNEKAILEKLTAAHDRAQEDKGTKQRVGSRTRPVCSRDGPGENVGCLPVLFGLRERHGRVKEAEDALREAVNILQGAQNELLDIYAKAIPGESRRGRGARGSTRTQHSD